LEVNTFCGILYNVMAKAINEALVQKASNSGEQHTW